MKCPYCGTNQTEVVETRDNEELETIRRRRACVSCGKRFTTYERIENVDLYVMKKDGRRELFNRDKLKRGMLMVISKDRSENKSIKIVSIIIFITGILVVIGWIFDIQFLKGIMPNWATMKISTALTFISSAILLCLLSKKDNSKELLAMASISVLLFMTPILISRITMTYLGVENMLIKEGYGASQTPFLGRPSLPTMISFILIGITGLSAAFKIKNLDVTLKIIGSIVAIIGGIAIIGYIIRIPELYYYIENVENAMALHTAALFLMMGMCLFKLGKNKN